MHTLLHDLRFAARSLSRTRTFTLAAVLAIALGVGANTAMFSVVNAVLLRELPYVQPERLVMLWERNLSSEQRHNVVNPANFLAWRESARSFSVMAAFTERRATVTGVGEEPLSVPIRFASAEIFPVLGVNPLLGRAYTAAEDVQGGPNVAVISYDFWKQRFAGRSSVVGETFRLNGNAYSVVGVLPAGFRFFEPVSLWVPTRFGAQARTAPGRYLRVIARVQAEVALSKADDEMRMLAQRRVEQAPELNANWTANAQPLRETLVGDVRTGLLVLLGAVVFLLVIACANVANLMLARAAERQKEVAIRASLGATQGRLVGQLLTESVLLSLVGSALGLGLAVLGTHALVALIPKDFPIPTIADVAVDGRVLTFTLGVALLTGIGFGLVPALALSRGALHDTLKEGGRTGSAVNRASARFRSALVVVELSLAIVLLAGAGLMTRSFSELRRVSLGFEPKNALMAEVAIPNSKYRSDTARIAFFRDVESRIAALPGVREVGAISFLPLTGQRSASSFTVPGRPAPPRGQEPVGDMRAVTPGYFRAMGIAITAGRPLGDDDRMGGPDVAVVSETLARTFWPGESAVGKYIDYEWYRQEHVQIVGVARDVHHVGADTRPFMEIYRPLAQFPYAEMTIIARADRDPISLANPIRQAVRSVDADQPVARLATMDALVSESLGTSRLSTMLFALFGVVGLVLAAVGIYGVISYGVMQRTREFGVRMALGALASDVRGMVVRQAATLTLLGMALGIAGALVATRLMRSLLFEVAPTDPLTYVGVALLLGLVALIASYLPARRATLVDPVIALRNE